MTTEYRVVTLMASVIIVNVDSGAEISSQFDRWSKTTETIKVIYTATLL